MLPLRQGIGNCPKHQWRRVISARVLLARLERALRATAGLLHDLGSKSVWRVEKKLSLEQGGKK
jgi:hypothetical protein